MVERFCPTAQPRHDNRKRRTKRPRLKRDFGSPLLVVGDDAKAYRAKLTELAVAWQPADPIEKIFVRDIAYLDGELLRFRGIRADFLSIHVLKMVRLRFKEVEPLYRGYKEKHPEGLDLDTMMLRWAQGDRDIRDSLDFLLSGAHMTRESLLVTPLTENIKWLEQIELVISRLEMRRNTMVREFLRYRAMRVLQPGLWPEQLPKPEHKGPETGRVHRRRAA